MDDKITLDKRSFEALAADTRVRILKSLDERRKTLSELARQMELSPSTVKEHMLVLEGARLVEMKDEGRKWKYYELTWKGRKVVKPRELKIWIVLSLSAVAMIAALSNFFAKLPGAPEPQVLKGAMDEAVRAPAEEAGALMAEEMAVAAPPVEPVVDLTQALLPDLVLLLIAAVVFGIAAGYFMRGRRG